MPASQDPSDPTGRQAQGSARYSAAWTAYWAGGARTSLPQDFADNYDGEIAAFWQARGDALDHSARILDVCTGNGAIALLFAAQAGARGADWQVEAVDAAHVDTRSFQAIWGEHGELLNNIVFHSGQPIEQFRPDGSGYHLITSQYGIEYCDWPAAARRIAALLRPGGHLAMINHAPDTALLETMREERADYRLLKETGAFELISRWLAGRLPLSELRDQLSRPETLISRAFQRNNSPLLEQARNTVVAVRAAPASELVERQQLLAGWIEQLQAGGARAANMLQVNEALAQNPDWLQIFVDVGLRIEHDEPLTYADRHVIGRARVLIRR